MPGATTAYRPGDLGAYENTPWDIRISMADAPLEDAFYYTVQDGRIGDLTIEKALDNFALNRNPLTFNFRAEILRFPELLPLWEPRTTWSSGSSGHPYPRR